MKPEPPRKGKPDINWQLLGVIVAGIALACLMTWLSMMVWPPEPSLIIE